MTNETLLMKGVQNEESVYRSFFFLPVAGQATSPAEERQDVTVLYNKMTLGDLQNTFSLNVSVISSQSANS